MTGKSADSKIEIIIGIVAPLGTERKSFIANMKEYFEKREYQVEEINLIKEFINISMPEPSKSFQYYLKMEFCTEIRKKTFKSFFACFASYLIKKKRDSVKKKKTVYIIDQIKNRFESDVLKYVYGKNYFQVTLFSSEAERDLKLKGKFLHDVVPKNSSDIRMKYNEEGYLPSHGKNAPNYINSTQIERYLKLYEKEILPDVTHNLMKKDLIDNIEHKKEGHGQQTGELFHRSHYYFNLDYQQDKVNKELKKFIKQLLSQYKEYPRQDEFGMSLAYQASVRSNFPGGRQIGAAILSPQGEVLSVASVRAPSKSSNPKRDDEFNIREGYNAYKRKIEGWINSLEENYTKEHEDIIQFLSDSLDFHPCTHAEIAAIIDAAKIGVSIRNSSLYTTTFPCHLCAKEIINAGIAKVIYLEAYPKSKNKELYPHLIDFDPWHESEHINNDIVPFYFYQGIAPWKFLSIYSLENKEGNKDNLPALFKYEMPEYYARKEKDLITFMEEKLEKNKGEKDLEFLTDLLGVSPNKYIDGD